MRGWTSSSKNPECPPERTKTKEENRLEMTKRKLKQAALEWDDLDILDQLKSFMYIEAACSEASRSEEEDVGIRKSRRKGDFEQTNEESNGKIVKRRRLNYLSVVKKFTLKI